MKPRFQFRLRTLFVVVTAWALLLAQWPWVEWTPPTYETTLITASPGVVVPKTTMVQSGFVPTRVVVVASLEAAVLIGWFVWRRARRPATLG